MAKPRARSSRPASDPALARLVRRSRALDPSARRHWLAVLPHLTADDRERLRRILLEAEGVTSSAISGEPDAGGCGGG